MCTVPYRAARQVPFKYQSSNRQTFSTSSSQGIQYVYTHIFKLLCNLVRFFFWGGYYECVDVRGQFPPDRTWIKLMLAQAPLPAEPSCWLLNILTRSNLSKLTRLKFWFNQALNSLFMATCGWLLAKWNRTAVERPSTVLCHRTRLGTPALAKAVASSDRRLAVKKKVQSAVPEACGSKGWQKALRSQWAGKRDAGLCSEVSASGVVSVSDKTVCLSAPAQKSGWQVLLWRAGKFPYAIPISTCSPQQCQALPWIWLLKHDLEN